MTVRHFTKKLTADEKFPGRIIEYNLYRVFLSICDGKRITEKIPALEKKNGTEELLRNLKNIAKNQSRVTSKSATEFAMST